MKYFFANGTLWITETGTVGDVLSDIQTGKLIVNLGQIAIDVKGECYIYNGKDFSKIGGDE